MRCSSKKVYLELNIFRIEAYFEEKNWCDYFEICFTYYIYYVLIYNSYMLFTIVKYIYF